MSNTWRTGLPFNGQLTISTQAIVSNWQWLSAQGRADCGAVVKANAYGLGVDVVAPALFEAGCRRFYVVTQSEAIQLRRLLPSVEASIIVLGGLAQVSLEDCMQHQLSPVLFSHAAINQWFELTRYQASHPQPVIEIDTGMGRLGINWREWPSVLRSIHPEWSRLNPLMIMSHLSCADTPSHALNQMQLERFESVKHANDAMGIDIDYSLANSSGILLGNEYHFHHLRPGAALYGINPDMSSANPMSQVVSLTLPVAQVKTLDVGDTVGYGATFEANKPMKIATVFGGYADGLSRSLSGGHVSIDYQLVPIVGRVSMDSFMVNITSLNFDVTPGSAVEIFPDNRALDRLATSAETIGYELLTRLGTRFQRCYK